MGNRTGTLTFVRCLGIGRRSESKFFNFSNSLQHVLSCLTDSTFGFPIHKHRRLDSLNVEPVKQSQLSRS